MLRCFRHKSSVRKTIIKYQEQFINFLGLPSDATDSTAVAANLVDLPMTTLVVSEDVEALSEAKESLQLQDVISLFIASVESGWFFIEDDKMFKFGKLEESEHFAQPQVSYLLTICKLSEEVALFRYGERLQVEKLAKNDFESNSLKKVKSNILSFIQTLKDLAVDHCSSSDVLSVCQAMINHQLKREEDCVGAFQKYETTLRFLNEQLKLVSRSKIKYSPAVIR